MKTRKSLLPIVLLCVTMASLAFCQEKRWPKAATKHRDKSAKGKYDPDYVDRIWQEEEEEDSAELYDRSSAATGYYDSRSMDTMAAYRNNRAIEKSRYAIIKTVQRCMHEFANPFDMFRVPINIYEHTLNFIFLQISKY